jgi:hypothetical protein
LTQPAKNPAAEDARTAPEFDYPVVWTQRHFIQEPLGRLGQVNILDLQPAGCAFRLTQHIALRFVHRQDFEIVTDQQNFIGSTDLS